VKLNLFRVFFYHIIDHTLAERLFVFFFFASLHKFAHNTSTFSA